MACGMPPTGVHHQVGGLHQRRHFGLFAQQQRMILQPQLHDLRGQRIAQRSAAGDQQPHTRPLLHHQRKGLQQAGQVLVLDQAADEEHEGVECRRGAGGGCQVVGGFHAARGRGMRRILAPQIMLAQCLHPCGIRCRYRHAVVHHMEMVHGPVHLPCSVFGTFA